MSETKLLDFNFAVCRNLYENAIKNDEPIGEALKYYHDRVFHTDNGGVYIYKKGDLIYLPIEEFKKNQLIGFDAKFKAAIEKRINPYEEVLEAGNWVIDKENKRINSMKAMYVMRLKDVKVGKKGKAYVEFFKQYLKDIMSATNEKVFQYLLKWLSNVVKLKKNKTALVFVSSTEGIGKSSLARIMQALLGIFHLSYPNPNNIPKFNFQLFGKLLVVIEETQGLKSDGDVLDKLKNLIDNDIFSYEAKGIQPKEMKNINNFMISSNFSLSTSGRRYVNITPSTKWLGREDMWEKLNDLDDENIKALYDYLMSIDTTNFNEQSEGKKLCAESGNLKEIERMNNVFAFMKDNYALDKISENIKPVDLFAKYKNSGIKTPYNKSTFYEKVSELNISKFIASGYEKYKIDGEQLYNEFKKRNLIHAEDFEKPVMTVDEVFGVDEEKESLKQENQDLKKQLAEMQKQLQILMEKNAPKEEEKEVKKEPVSGESTKILKVKAWIQKK